jgi:hypothetical protein
LRNAIACVVCLAALLAAGCAKQDSTIAKLEGSEPQRLSFGAPDEVQKAFTAQMQSCWFTGSSAPLSGYQYDARPAVMETGQGLTELRQISIRSQGGREDFLIQFYPFNNNTLISTRNLSLPIELAAKLKQDVETWIFGREGCDGPTGSLKASAENAVVPQTSSSLVQNDTSGGWAPAQEQSAIPPSRY